MVAEDRRLKLTGYEVFRLGVAGFTDPEAEEAVLAFFTEIVIWHGVSVLAGRPQERNRPAERSRRRGSPRAGAETGGGQESVPGGRRAAVRRLASIHTSR